MTLTPRLTAVLVARDISRRSYRRTRHTVALAFMFNRLGIPAAVFGLVYSVWAMVAMAASVTAIFLNSIGGRPALPSTRCLGQPPAERPQPAAAPATQ